MFVKWQDHVYDFEIMIWNHVSDSGKSNAPLVGQFISLLRQLVTVRFSVKVACNGLVQCP